MRKLTETERKIWNSYKIMGCTPLHRVKVNYIRISPANSKAHEMKKCEICYELARNNELYMVECQENKTNIIRDVVSLTTGEIYEVVHENYSKELMEKYKKDHVRIIFTKKPYICAYCSKEFRAKKGKKFCCFECKSHSQELKKEELICTVCGKAFGFGKKFKDTRVTCSYKCRNKLIGLKNKGNTWSENRKSEFSEQRKGNKNQNWKGGLTKDKKEYNHKRYLNTKKG